MDGNENANFVPPAPPMANVPTAPPPPPEVKVRTMRSDLAAMAKSGGGLPSFESVKVMGLSLGKTGAEIAAAAEPKKNNTVIILVAIAAVAALGLVGYLAYTIFFAGGTAGAPSSRYGAQAPAAAAVPQVVPPTAASSSATASASGPAAPFMHKSLFKRPADQTLTLALSAGGVATGAADLQTFNQKLSSLLAAANKNTGMIEVDMQTPDGHGVAVSDLLAQANAGILNAQALAHFNPDATFFVYRDKSGFSPGIVLSLKSGDNWLYAKNDVAQLESSPDIVNLFLQNVGTPAGSGFADSAISSTAVRVLSFPNATPPAYFIYGWYQTDLILSTSENGFTAATKRL